MHLVGHVSNEELVAYYELADVFVCASEHEGFCVPLVESFHMGVPVLAYAATAVPSTMDGAGVLYTDKDPMHVAGAHQRRRRRSGVSPIRSSADRTRRSTRLEAKDFAGTLLRLVDSVLALAAPQHPPVAFDFWDQVELAEEFDEISMYRPAAFHALPGTTEAEAGRSRCDDTCSRSSLGRSIDMIVNQWVPAAHKGDAIGDSARAACAALLREMGHQSDLYAMTIDDDLRGDVIAWTDPRRDARRPDDLSFRAGVADDRGVRAAAARPRAAVSQRDAGAFLRRLRRRRSTGWRCSAART